MKRTAYIILSIAVLAGCSKPALISEQKITMTAGISDIEVSSKAGDDPASANEYSGTVPTNEKPLNAAVWFSYSSTVFSSTPTDDVYLLPCHTTMQFTSSAKTYARIEGKDLKYPIPTAGNETVSSVYSVGFHPNSGWDVTDNTEKGAKHVISGSEDLMFADIIEGKWNDPFPAQNYKHLLTWVKINVCATTPETAVQWGNVTDVWISSKENVEVQFGYNTEENKGISTVSYTGNEQYIRTFSGDSPLGLVSQQVGSVFCSPSDSYTIRIKTENMTNPKEIRNIRVETIETEDGTEAVAEEDYLPAEQLRGKLVIINLYFQPYDIVEGTCSLYYWNNKNEDLYLEEVN